MSVERVRNSLALSAFVVDRRATELLWLLDAIGALGSEQSVRLRTPAAPIGVTHITNPTRMVLLKAVPDLPICGLVLAWLLGTAACFSPEITRPLPCSESQACPPGQVCDSAESICRAPVKIVGIRMGDHHTCAITGMGAVRCWGRGNDHRLGFPGFDAVGDGERPSARPSLSLPPITDVGLGDRHSCAVTGSGAVYCWGGAGRGATGYLGDGADHPVRGEPIPLSKHVEELAISAGHSCARTSDGEVYCWGANQVGQLGYGNTTDIGLEVTPDAVGSVDLGARALSLVGGSGFHTCALLEDGRLRCWGGNTNGQLGYATTELVSLDQVPDALGDVQVGGPVMRAALGVRHTCVVLETGVVRCWGQGELGRLGYASEDSIFATTPAEYNRNVNLGEGEAALDIAVGQDHSCALLRSGNVMCWGSNARGQLGVGAVDAIGDDEEPINGGFIDMGGRAAAIAAAGQRTCVLTSDERVRCWGQGNTGSLGCGDCSAPQTGDGEPVDTSCDIRTEADACDISIWEP